MTTTYHSKKQAIETGILYARGRVDVEAKKVSEEEMTSGLSMLSPELAKGFGESSNVLEVYEVENSKGKMVRFGVSPFRSGWNLWFIADNGMMMRA